MTCYNAHILNEKKKQKKKQSIIKKVFFNYFDKKSQEAMLKISMEMQKSYFSFKLISNPILLDFSLTVKAATLIFISGRGSAISSAKEGKSGFIHNLVNI